MSVRPRLFLGVPNRIRRPVLSSGSGTQVWTERATATNALEAITNSRGPWTRTC